MFLAGALDLRSEIPALRVLEKCHVHGSVGPGDKVSIFQDAVRQSCHTALRRLGEVPHSAPGVRLMIEGDGVRSRNLESDVSLKERVAASEKIKKGDSVESVVKTIGLPDFSPWERNQVFEYDMDGDAPFTLRLELDDERQTVTGIERLDTRTWKKISKRDMGFW